MLSEIDDGVHDGGARHRVERCRAAVQGRDHFGGTMTVAKERTAHVAQSSHCVGCLETVPDAIADDEPTPSPILGGTSFTVERSVVCGCSMCRSARRKRERYPWICHVGTEVGS